ncbi:uncharacterized protein LOC119354462 isoform X1 [Triticum dicoccoides]|uniref:uncharacterized protein LOC119354462 isoform X1 n=1 Tax=Triticum dicoccoides TaxID=85692 RepID=UPI0018903718|nr:uncharacterized protein LOC119354462 isoform X1 [Triticum dicoccoides]XP_037477087.1 uncharacterized protein LOC119354462 isoform X1 [Triticum dicoccoides]
MHNAKVQALFKFCLIQLHLVFKFCLIPAAIKFSLIQYSVQNIKYSVFINIKVDPAELCRWLKRKMSKDVKIVCPHPPVANPKHKMILVLGSSSRTGNRGQSREVISNSKKALLDNALSQPDAFKKLESLTQCPDLSTATATEAGAGNTSSNRGEGGHDLRRRASTERKTLGLEERLSRANAAMKTLGQSGDEDPAPRRHPKLSAAMAAKADQIEDLVVDLLLLGTIQREVTKRKNFRSNPAAQVGEGTPMAAAQLCGGARRLRGGPARLLRDDAGRLLHRRLGSYDARRLSLGAKENGGGRRGMVAGAGDARATVEK